MFFIFKNRDRILILKKQSFYIYFNRKTIFNVQKIIKIHHDFFYFHQYFNFFHHDGNKNINIFCDIYFKS